MPGSPAAADVHLPSVPPPREELWRPFIPARLGAVVLIAVVAIVFSLGFLILNGSLERLVWAENVLLVNRWMIPILVVLFSLVVGLSRRHLRAPSAIDAGFVEMVRGDGESGDYRQFPGAFVSSLASLLSGASIGPEGVLGVLVSEISAFLRPYLRIPKSAASGFDLAALASAFNGLIGGVLFTGVFATELQSGRAKSPLQCLVWNLIAGAVGFLVFRATGFQAFAEMIPFPPAGLTAALAVVAVLCGVLATVIAIAIGAWLQVAEKAMDRIFGERVVLRVVGAGLVIGLVCYVFPDLLFSGENQIHDFIADPAFYGAALLLLLAVLKIALFGISIKAGYIGGPVFPIIFACTLIGLALNLLVPGIPAGVFVLCIEAGAIAVALGAPLTAILLVSIMSGADQDMVVLLVLSIATALLLSAEAMKRIEARRATGVGGAAAGTR
ncbi:MAG: chloride channel protein [Methanospirillum sp.]|nr:chloride channel protein [Methanospirillum sp.]